MQARAHESCTYMPWSLAPRGEDDVGAREVIPSKANRGVGQPCTSGRWLGIVQDSVGGGGEEDQQLVGGESEYSRRGGVGAGRKEQKGLGGREWNAGERSTNRSGRCMTGRESGIIISAVPHRRGMKTVGISPDKAGRKNQKIRGINRHLIGISTRRSLFSRSLHCDVSKLSLREFGK